MKLKIDQMTEQEKDVRLARFLNASEDQLFPQEDIAIYLTCSTHTLQRLRCAGGGIPYSKIGRTVTYRKADVLAFQKKQTFQNTAQFAS